MSEDKILENVWRIKRNKKSIKIDRFFILINKNKTNKTKMRLYIRIIMIL